MEILLNLKNEQDNENYGNSMNVINHDTSIVEEEVIVEVERIKEETEDVTVEEDPLAGYGAQLMYKIDYSNYGSADGEYLTAKDDKVIVKDEIKVKIEPFNIEDESSDGTNQHIKKELVSVKDKTKPIKQLETEVIPTTGEKSLCPRCDVCKQQFNSKNKIIRHIKKKHPELDEKTFSRGFSLQEHLKVKPYTCKQCNIKFNRSSTLLKHMQTHSGEKAYACYKCKKRFKRNTTLQKHLKIHSDEESYPCKLCDKVFYQKARLQKHMKIHTSERPYQCERCKKAFKQSCSLKRHIRIHTGERPYVCTHCNKRFIESSALNQHLRIHTGEKPYACTECHARFSQVSALQRHKMTHTGEKPYVCSNCDKRFIHKGNLQQHINIHTKPKKLTKKL